MLVFDSTPLIYLGKVELLADVSELESGLVVPERVHREVVEIGTERGYPDARKVEQCIENGVFEVRPAGETALFERLLEDPNLSGADAAVLALADKVDGTAVMDDGHGRTVADVEGVATRGTAGLLLDVVDGGVVSAEEAKTSLDEMLEAGWYCSTDVYAKIVNTIEDRS